jgi:hypothetical protein
VAEREERVKAFLRSIFGRKPQAGDVYTFDDGTSNPYGKLEFQVEVLSTRKGWVKYRYTTGGTNEMKISSFRYCFREEPPCAQSATTP